MFDIGFWELTVIGVIGLLVLGPERLPTAIRTVRGWIRGVRQFSNNVQTEIKEELRVHELHEHLKKAEQAEMKNLSPEIAESVKTLQEAAQAVNRPYADLSNPEHQAQNQNSTIEQEPEKLDAVQDTKPAK